MRINQSQKDLVSTFASQSWRILSSPVTMLMIPLFMSATEQGYWYLFCSLSALSVFADLGFSNIIMQFSAHEYAHLNLSLDNKLVGDAKIISKLGSFYRFSIKWVSFVSLIVFPIIYLIGMFFLFKDGVLALYIIPWTIYSIAISLQFINNTILSFISGMNKIAEIEKIRLISSIISTSTIVVGLLLHLNIYAFVLASLLLSMFTFVCILLQYGKIIKQLLINSATSTHNWNKEVVPLFSKYVVSYASTYITTQIYVPLAQYFFGPIVGGKIGITMSITNAIITISNIFIYTIIPRMNMCVSKKSDKELFDLVKKRFYISVIVFWVIFLGFVSFVWAFHDLWIFPKIFSRFLSMKQILILIACYFLQHIVNTVTVFWRAHKEEPFAFINAISALWIFIGSVVICRFLSSGMFFFGFLSNFLWYLPVMLVISGKRRRYWYGK